ncbi:phosphoribosylpyrophosphate synthetase [Lujinxingia litoralis]|uniref:ribose-phosphate diphosphokinase n=1 Tax=Lujinxingia litoralis TaxID=2211119 RepID=A0A328CB13_9DELT|nr:ribose-phosphate pyrophosphokinase [Lujinxingia litoralis]RAL22963.1 phosphoribosylpyrophosphate synthetase [Lujinxingia litoralis]
MKALIVSAPADRPLAEQIAAHLDAELAVAEVRAFPDEETYVRIDSEVSGRQVVVVANLVRPNAKVLPALFLAETARELDAASIGLATPYLPYMRQDARFAPGEGLTSRYFGALISRSFDWLATIDPHLHRYHSLDECYAIPSRVAESATPIARWLVENIERPLIVGPDEESYQWVAAVAQKAGLPSVIMDKIRHGDREVKVTGSGLPPWTDQTPVILDDIISTGRTMVETVRHLREAGLKPPVCVGVHALFVGDAYQILRGSGVERVVTCNTISHLSNAIDVIGELAAAVGTFIED